MIIFLKNTQGNVDNQYTYIQGCMINVSRKSTNRPNVSTKISSQNNKSLLDLVSLFQDTGT